MNRKLAFLITFLLLVSISSVTLKVQRVEASGTIYIKADGSIDPSTAPISTVDNTTYAFTSDINDSIVIEKDSIVLDGAGYTVQGTGNGTGIKLVLRKNITIQNTVTEGFEYGIYLGSSSGNSITRNNITNNGNAIVLYSSLNNSITENNITANNGDGLYLYSSSNNNSVVANSIANNQYGIAFYSSDYNRMAGNNITNNAVVGINVDSSSINNIVGNTITDNGDGIILYRASDNSVAGNSIISNNAHALAFLFSSNNNVVANSIANNQRGGIYLSAFSNHNNIAGNNIATNKYGIWLTSSSNNSIYHNNFINNTVQIGCDFYYHNILDDGYPSGGNYWSDYNGTDANHDGIGDTPYVIDANNTDHYPLIISESPLFLVLPLFMMATLLSVTIYRMRHRQSAR